jgi:hypothetical protein
MGTRRQPSGEFKAKVVLAVLRGVFGKRRETDAEAL